jgi:hypothetical protein
LIRRQKAEGTCSESAIHASRIFWSSGSHGTQLCVCVRPPRPHEHPFLPSFLGARKIFSVVSSRGDATTMRSCAPDNGREPPENFTRTMSPRVYHSVVYEFALVYHSMPWHFSSFHLNGWRSLTSFVDRFVRIALHYFGIESFF